MIKIVFLIFISTCSLFATEKDSIMNLMTGRWQLVRQCGGIGGGCVPAHYENIVIRPDTISPDSLYYSIYYGDSLAWTYHTLLSKYNSVWLIYLALPRRFVSATDSSLSLADYAVDGFGYSYIRADDVGIENIAASAYSPDFLLPNPCFSVAQSAGKLPNYKADIFAINGKLVASFRSSGIFRVNFNYLNIPSGIYFIRFNFLNQTLLTRISYIH